MIREYIIVLTDQQSAELIKRAEAENYVDELEFLQIHLDKWLSDSNRLIHKEK